MIMAPGPRKFTLTVHIVSSMGWLGAVFVYLALAAAALSSDGLEAVRASWWALQVALWFVIVPLSLVSLLSGIAQGLGTPWGLFRHYWVLFKLLLTVFATVILLLHLPTVTSLAAASARQPGVDQAGLVGELVHGGGGLLVLLGATTLSVYKPRGETGFGRRNRTHPHRRS